MSDKYLAFTLLPLGIVLTITSLFVFAIGWDKLKGYLESGSVNGQVVTSLADSPFPIKVNAALHELDGSLFADTNITSDGHFELAEITPGDYQISISGNGFRTLKKAISVFPKRSTEVGSVPLQFDVLMLGEKENVPSYRYAAIHKSKDGNLWALGFQSKDNHSTYKVLRKRSGVWNEVIIPQFKGAIQAISVNSLGNSLLIGSAGNGAVLSRNNGQSWEQLEFDNDIWGAKDSAELPDKSWVIAAVGGKRYQYSTGVILKSNDEGASWHRKIEIEDSINKILVLSSGRVLFSTASPKNRANIYYSDDYGESWDVATIPEDYKLRGISDIIETQDGILYAGNIDGSNWKGDFTKGGVILQSQDNGLSWTEFYSNSKWRGVNALFENDEKHLFVWNGADINVTFDRGSEWSNFGQTGAGYKRTLFDQGEELYVIGGQSIYRFDSSVFSPVGFNKRLKSAQ